MERVKVGINGMGRIGRNLYRAIMTEYADTLQVVAVNDLFDTETIARTLRRDSVYGRFPVDVRALGDDSIQVGEETVRVFRAARPAEINWNETGAEVVFECTGINLTSEATRDHLGGSVDRVVLSAPPKDGTPMFVIGVNDHELSGREEIVSNASCTTNCLAPLVKAVDDAFGIVGGLMTTTHAVTSGQKTVDSAGNERARSALNNIIPTSTGAARAIGKVIKHLEGKLNGSSLRVPVTTGSVVEAVFTVPGRRTTEDVIAALRAGAAAMNLRSPIGRVLYVGDDYQVSADAIGSTWSSMVPGNGIMAVPAGGETMIKITSFYDNELGYAHRLAELGILVAGQRG